MQLSDFGCGTAVLSITALVLLAILIVREYIVPVAKGLKRVPEALVWPYRGDTQRLLSDGEQMYAQRMDKYGPVFSTWILGRRSIVIGALDTVKWCLTKEHGLLEADWPASTRLLLGKGSLAASSGERHLLLRKLLKPAFSLPGVAQMVPKMGAIAEQCMSKWASKGRVQGLLAAKEFTFRVILELVFGFEEGRLSPELVDHYTNTFIVLAEHLFSYPINFPGFGFWTGMKAKKALIDIIKDNMNYIRERQKRVGTASDVDQVRAISCVEEILVKLEEAEEQMSDDDVADMLVNLLFAGHDTSAHTLTRLLAELPRHPEVWDRLKREQAEVVAEQGPEMSADALKAMTYLEVVIKEMQRLHPIVGGVFRKATEDFELPGGFYIPKGRQIFLNLGHSLKYDERWAGETGRLSPHCFCPERWLSEEGQKTGAFLPFGAGLRMCIGFLLAQTEMKVFVATLVRGYSYAPEDVNEPWNNWPFGGEPVHDLQMQIKKI
ncbi:hypothetical protein CVIRNUC_008488 [Coccomyxa viridis]|uniref:Cytochrome P450 n=1 Tax=Coccomyxa viridis TaxID=1274662 RepID=A0AAV1IDP7_9CHLO|nr:hypothetical protein CVIRNUC_008488 [Coccomyxa viridis]